MAMKILGNESPKDIFLEASDILAKAVKHTLGPKGLNTAVCTSSSGHYQIINDGKSIVQDLTSDNPALAPALELLKQSCFETNRKAGDGTTSTILMTNKLLHNVYDYLELHKEVNATTLRNRLNEVQEELIKQVDSVKQELTENKYIDVATVALGGNEYASLVADAYKFVGPDGVVAFMREDRKDVVLECEDGVALDKTEFKITPMKEPREYHSLKVVIIYEKIDRFAEIIGLLNKSTEFKGKKTILLYNEMSWDASSNIYANVGEGRIDVIPIRLGSYGTATRDVMEQLAEYCDCKLIDGQSVKLATLNENLDDVFGNIDKAMLSEDKVIIKTEKEIKENKNYVLQLKNKSCIIRVGGSNKVEQEETFRRIEDAVSSLGSAIKDGIIIGGGLAYKNAFESVRAMYKDIDYLSDVGEIIYKTVMYNTNGLIDMPDNWEGISNNVFDSVVVVKEVIRNSFSLVAQIITTNILIHEMIR